MFKTLINLLLNKSFWIGLIFGVSIFSRYIFGPDNIVEEVGELLIHITTNKTIDFSPDVSVHSNELIDQYKGLTNGEENLPKRD